MSERFEKESIKRWRWTCHKEVDRLDGKNGDPYFRAAALVAMSIYAFGTDVAVLSELSGQTPGFVRTILKRLRQERVLTGQRMRVSWNDKGAEGEISLVCDLLVATGHVTRPPDPKRSAALKGKAGRKRGGTNRTRKVVSEGAVFTPQVKPVPEQLYQIVK